MRFQQREENPAMKHLDTVLGFMKVLYIMDLSDTERVPARWYVRAGELQSHVFCITVTHTGHRIERVR